MPTALGSYVDIKASACLEYSLSTQPAFFTRIWLERSPLPREPEIVSDLTIALRFRHIVIE